MVGKIIYVDIDKTICSDTHGSYNEVQPNLKHIEKINKLFLEGNTIIY